MEQDFKTRVLTVLAGNCLIIAAVGSFVLSWNNGKSPSIVLVPAVAGILCFVARFHKDPKVRAILLLVAGFFPIVTLPITGLDLRRYDEAAKLLVDIQDEQLPWFWLLFTAGYGAIIIAAVVSRETRNTKLPPKFALGGGILLLASLGVQEIIYNGEPSRPIALFPLRLYGHQEWIRGNAAVIMLLALITAAVLSIAWGLGIRKRTRYPKLILRFGLGALVIMWAGLLLHALTTPLRYFNYSNNLIWVWHAFLYLSAPLAFLMAKCLGFITLLKLKQPAPAAPHPIPSLNLPLLKDTPPHSGPLMRTCPCCNQKTSSLKQFHHLDLLLFAGIYIAWLVQSNVACPKCMRQHVIEKGVNHMLMSNVFWPVIVFPWGIVLLISSFIPGHSYFPQSRP